LKNSTDITGIRIKELIRAFISTSSQNTMRDNTGESAWDDVLVGFASGADPIWQQYKE